MGEFSAHGMAFFALGYKSTSYVRENLIFFSFTQPQPISQYIIYSSTATNNAYIQDSRLPLPQHGGALLESPRI